MDREAIDIKDMPAGLPHHVQVVWRLVSWKGWNQTTLARTIGVKQPQARRLLYGGSRWRVDRLEKLAKALQMPMEMFWFDWGWDESAYQETIRLYRWFKALPRRDRRTVLRYGLTHYKVYKESLNETPIIPPLDLVNE